MYDIERNEKIGFGELLEIMTEMNEIMNVITIPQDTYTLSSKIIRIYKALESMDGKESADNMIINTVSEVVLAIVRDVIENTDIPREQLIKLINLKLNLLL